MTAAPAVEDLVPAHPEPRNDVLEIGHRRGRAAEYRRVERTSPRSEQPEHDKAAADLEAPVGNVLVRQAIAGDVERRTEQECERSRADEGSQRRARGDVQRDDHSPIIASRFCVSLRIGVPGRLVGDSP